ncbi:MAG: trypsin-like peptidase domain-containing protein [Candidatus Harrisonbacteria bacterium]|nr:trypsin-like peptidase domain-containing protein [Candidatus Harrisonbacteria bacterium]
MKYLILVVVSLVIVPDAVFTQEAQQESEAVRIFRETKDCVVDVHTTAELEKPYYGSKTVSWGGAGFFSDKKCHVATAAHVIRSPNGKYNSIRIINYSYTVATKTRKYQAELVRINPGDQAELKVLNINPPDYKAVKFGDPNKVKIGETVYAIGSPYGLSNSFTSGIVSALNRIFGMNYIEAFIQTSAQINPGNSGGPLFNSAGEVIGIVTARIVDDGLGFVVPVTLFRPSLMKKYDVDPPWFGAEALLENFARMGTPEKPHMYDLSMLYKLTGIGDPAAAMLLAKLTYPKTDATDRWAIVISVDSTKLDGKHSPAYLAGIKKGDLITKFNGKPIQSGMDLRIGILEAPKGKEFEIELIRAEAPGVSRTITVKVKLEGDPDDKHPTF